MTDNQFTPPPFKIFLSYARRDDESFHFAKSLKGMLERLLTGMSGRPAEVFLDRTSIALGTDWKEEIERGVNNSMTFIAMFSGAYAMSSNCREEFLHFEESAARSRVGRLLIPVALYGLDDITNMEDDPVTDYVRDHQAADFHDALIEGDGSPAFRRVAMEIARRIIEVTSAADQVLADDALGTASDASATPPTDTRAHDYHQEFDREPNHEDSSDHDDDGLIELSIRFQESVAEMTQNTTQMATPLQKFSELPPRPDNLSQKDVPTYFVRVAQHLSAPSHDIQAYGLGLFEATRKADSALRQTLRLIHELGSHDVVSGLRASIRTGLSSLGSLEHVSQQLNELTSAFQVAEAMSAAVRRALRPTRDGIRAVQDSLSLVSDWDTLADSLDSE